jgi:hypothetical protein
VALRELRLDLGPDLADHHRQRLLAEHVRLQLVDQRGLDLLLALETVTGQTALPRPRCRAHP